MNRKLNLIQSILLFVGVVVLGYALLLSMDVLSSFILPRILE